MSAKPSEVRKTMTLDPSRFKSAEYVRQIYRIVPPEGHTMDDIVRPAYWAHIARDLRPGDHVEVFPDDQSYWADLIVLGADRLSAVVAVLNFQEIGANAAESNRQLSDEFKVEWKGPQHKWSIIRVSDSAYIKEGFETKEIATQGLLNYVKKIG